MALSDTIIRVNAKGNDIRRRLLMTDERCFLLKRGKETKRFTKIVEITEGWNVKFNGYRQQMGLEIATSTANFRNIVSQTSYIAYGSPRVVAASTTEYDVYSILNEQIDVIPPTGSSPLWKFYLTREPQERFRIEEL